MAKSSVKKIVPVKAAAKKPSVAAIMKKPKEIVEQMTSWGQSGDWFIVLVILALFGMAFLVGGGFI